MATRDPRVDAYIEKSADFAKPVLRHVREVVHSACPGVEETMRWGFPHFDHGGILCSMAAFTEHCAVSFWNAEAVLGDAARDGAMGHLGRITTIRDLPPKRALAGYVKKAAALRAAGVKPKRARGPSKSEAVPAPRDLDQALAENPEARKTFESFSPSHRREYVEWITEAKRDDTRRRRIAQAVQWMAEGKPRNWKYR